MLEALSCFYWPHLSRVGAWQRHCPFSDPNVARAHLDGADCPPRSARPPPPARAWLATLVLCHMHHLRSVASDALWPRGAMAVALGDVVDDRGGPSHLGPACSLGHI